MKQLFLEFLCNPNKTAFVSLLSVLCGQTTEIIAQGTTEPVLQQYNSSPAIIQIVAYLAAISAGIFSIANTLKCWYRDNKDKDKILK